MISNEENLISNRFLGKLRVLRRFETRISMSDNETMLHAINTSQKSSQLKRLRTSVMIVRITPQTNELNKKETRQSGILNF